MSMFEAATHIPFIMRAPWMTESVGKVTWAFTEMVDVYPTLTALAGLPDPVSKGEHLNGTSMVPLFADPSASIKKAAFSQFAKCGEQCTGANGVQPKPKSEWKGPHNWYDIGPHYSRKQTTVMG